MINHVKCYHRDNAISQAVERHGVLNAEQVESMFFNGLSCGKRIAQRRLKRLHDTKRLKRGRMTFDQPYYYYLGKAPGQVEHRLGVNWVYIWIIKQLKSWEILHSLEYEVDYKTFRMDALVTVRNKVTGKLKLFYIEMDRSDNNFNKVQQLNQFYQTKKYLSAWWVATADRFPAIIVATETEKRYRHIQTKIKEENAGGLEFQLYLLSELREECLSGSVYKA